MQDINDPELRAEMEAEFKTFLNSVKALRKDSHFKIYLDAVAKTAEYTKEKLTSAKDYEDIKKLQTYYQFINDLLNFANYEERDNNADTAE